jgi:hypothetical protein
MIKVLGITTNALMITVLMTILIVLLPSQSVSDEIWFQNKGDSQQGTILGEDNQNIIVRFPKSTIKAIKRNEKETTDYSTEDIRWKKTSDYLILEIPRRYIETTSSKALDDSRPKSSGALYKSETSLDGKIESLEVRMNRLENKGASVSSELSENKKVHQTLIDEEMGSVKGVIKWNKMPMKNGKVKISLEKYTGFSMGSLKKLFAKDNKTSEKNIEIETRADSKGSYVFTRVPPGYYRLYWMPKGEDGWIHRLRDQPDFEVIPGKMTVQNIPEKKK